MIENHYDFNLESENDSLDALNQTVIDLKDNDDVFLGEYQEEFIIGKLIRTDLISKIYEAENIKEHRNVCLKIFDKKLLEKGDYDFFLEQINREEEIVKLCKCENIVNIYRKLETKNNIIFEMESWETNLADYIEKNGSLVNKISSFIEILSGIINALKLLYKKGVMHRDIRPRNIFLVKDIKLFYFGYKIKLGGFDYSIYIKDNTSETIGSIFYAAPEIIKSFEYDEKCDLWSLGITLHKILFGYLPYGKNPTINIVKKSIYYEDNFIFETTNNRYINLLLKKLLVVNKKNRINFEILFDFFDQNIKNIKIDAPNGNIISYQISPYDMIMEERDEDSYLNKNKYMQKALEISEIKGIIDGELLPDIMYFSNGCVESKEKFNNIIYYDENLDYITSIKKESDLFEKKTSGAFILCNYLKSMEIIRTEILKQIKKDRRTTFNLITTGSACEKIMNFINKDKDFEKCIKNICIYCMNVNKYLPLKEKYPKIHDDIYNKRNDVIKFINKYSDINTKAFRITKLITLEDYKDKYKERHLKISEFYGNINIKTYEKYYKKIINLINFDEQNKELKESKEILLRALKTFKIRSNSHTNLNSNEQKLYNEYLEYLDKIIIKEYTKNTLYGDLNKWLLNFGMNYNYYESVAYFTGRLMYSLNSYAKKNKKYFTENKTKIYRGIKIPYSSLLPYERAKGKIILISSFTSTTESKEISLKFSGRNNSQELYKTNSLFSVLFIIKNFWKKNWISNGIDIQEESTYKKEKEILFQPFSFYFVSDVKIDLNKYTADIYLQTVGKTQILEEEIKNDKEIEYNKSENLIELKDNMIISEYKNLVNK